MIPTRNIRFLQELQFFLNTHGEIYTVRRFLYHRGCDLVSVNYSGAYRRKFIGEVTHQEDLEAYVNLSGTESKLEWWAGIINLNHGLTPSENRPFYLYRIKVIKSASQDN